MRHAPRVLAASLLALTLLTAGCTLIDPYQVNGAAVATLTPAELADASRLAVSIGSGRLTIIADPEATDLRIDAAFSTTDAAERDAITVVHRVDNDTLTITIENPNRPAGSQRLRVDSIALVAPPAIGGVALRVGSGEARIAGLPGVGDPPVLGTIDVGSGDADIESCRGDLHIRVGSGSVATRDCPGPLTVTVGSGDARLDGVRHPFSVASGSGSIDITTARDFLGPVTGLAGSGDVTIDPALLPGDGSPSIARAGSGGVRVRRTPG